MSSIFVRQKFFLKWLVLKPLGETLHHPMFYHTFWALSLPLLVEEAQLRALSSQSVGVVESAFEYLNI